jgi:integrase
MIATYIYSGLCREEAIWQTVEDVDFALGRAGAIRIRAKTVNGKFWQPKTKVNRVVPVSQALRAVLDAYVRPVVQAP